MKTIEPISIWDKGQSKQATILNAYAVNVTLNTSATFWYGLMTENMEIIAYGNLSMDGEEYQLWRADEFAWEFVAHSLNLVITGEYVPPTTTTTSTTEEPTTTTTTTDIVIE